ncbi:MAG: phage integrase N-terminal SAM-like domain-containing protein [Acidobacteriota bacterium]|nr:phage integrase N-terminal SAM-like domain-containing protein [Acidobacteriota bacterium]
MGLRELRIGYPYGIKCRCHFLFVQSRNGFDLVSSHYWIALLRTCKSRKTHPAYSITLQGFAEACEAETLEELTRHDLLAYVGMLRDDHLTPRTIASRLSFLKTLSHHFEVAWPLMKTDRVKLTEKQAEAHSVEVLQKLFEEADQDECDLLQFLLCTGDQPILYQF